MIFLSARGDVADKVQGLEVGAVDYIEKPFQFEEVVDVRNLSKPDETRLEKHLKCAVAGCVRRRAHCSEQAANQRYADQGLQRVAELDRESNEFHAFLVGACCLAGVQVPGFADNLRQLAVGQQPAPDPEVELEGRGIELDSRRRCFERVRRQRADDDGRGTFDVMVAFADADAAEIADHEIDGFRVPLGFEQVGKERQHVVELPARETIVGFHQLRVAEILGVQLVAARDGMAELRCGVFSAFKQCPHPGCR